MNRHLAFALAVVVVAGLLGLEGPAAAADQKAAKEKEAKAQSEKGQRNGAKDQGVGNAGARKGDDQRKAEQEVDREKRRVAAKTRVAGELLAQFDRNGDGTLDADERKAALAARAKERRAKARRKRESAQPVAGAGAPAAGLVPGQNIPSGRAQGGLGDGRDKLLAKFDRNRNGRLDPDEAKAAEKALGASGADLSAAQAGGDRPATGRGKRDGTPAKKPAPPESR